MEQEKDTYLRGEEGWWDWERLAKEHVRIAHGHRQQSGETGR